MSEEESARRLPVRKEDISRLTPARYGRADIARMIDAADPAPLLDAAADWDAAAGLLATLHDDLRARAEELAADWDGAAAAACQLALRRIAGTARQLSRYAEDLRTALSAAAEAQQLAKQQLARFRTHPTLPGGIEVGGTGGRLLDEVADPALSEQLDTTARQWLQVVYDGYRAAMAALPDHVAFDLPGLVVPDLPGVPRPASGTDPPPAGRGGPGQPPGGPPVGAAPAAASYGGYAGEPGTTLAGGLAAAPGPLDPGQPDGGAWQGAGSGPAATPELPGPAVEPNAAPASSHPGTTPADAGSIVGTIAEALAGADQPVPGGAAGMQADTGPAVDAPYIAATVADAVAAAAQQHDPAGPASGDTPGGTPGGTDDTPGGTSASTRDDIPGGASGGAPAPLPDAHTAEPAPGAAPGDAPLPDAHTAEPAPGGASGGAPAPLPDAHTAEPAPDAAPGDAPAPLPDAHTAEPAPDAAPGMQRH